MFEGPQDVLGSVGRSTTDVSYGLSFVVTSEGRETAPTEGTVIETGGSRERKGGNTEKMFG